MEMPSADEPASTAAPAQRFSPGDILQAAGAAAGTTAIIYVVGGMVMWLRFRKAGLPPDHAVALMERQQLLVIGLRLMVLPALLTGAVAWWVIFRARSSAAPLPGSGRRAATILKWTVVVLAAMFALMLPFSFASATWVLAALVVVGYLRYERRPRDERTAVAATAPPPPPAKQDDEPEKLTPQRVLAWLRATGARARTQAAQLAAYAPFRRRRAREASRLIATMLVVIVAALVSLGRQLDQPVQLLTASVSFTGTQEPIVGQYISSDGSEVFLGIDGRVTAIPRSTIRDVTLGPPQERAPSPSIVSRVFSEDRFAITPFEWWCNGERYSWGELGELCKTQLGLEGHPSQDLVKNHIPVNVKCPIEANEPCRGFLTLSSPGRYQVGKGIPRRVVFDAPVIPFGRQAEPAVAQGTSALICVPVDPGQRGLLRNVAPVGTKTINATIPFNLKVSADRAGRNVLRSTTYYVNIKPEAQQSQSECSTLRKPEPKPRVTCTSASGKRAQRPDISCTVNARTRFRGLVTVAVTRAETVYAQGASVADGRKLFVQATPSRTMAGGVYRATIVLGANKGTAQTFRALIRLR
jgi:hypothetical protein